MTDSVIGAKLEALQKSVDDGFSRVDKRLESVETDVKALREEGLPRRVSRLEKWRESLSARSWAFVSGGVVAVIAAWAAVFVP